MQGVHARGETKRERSRSESNCAQRKRGTTSERGLVTGIRPETRRSSPGQDEAGRKTSGGLLANMVLTCRVTWG